MALFMRGYGQYNLGPPAVIGGGIAFGGPRAYSIRNTGEDSFFSPRKAHFRLRPPAVVGAGIVNPGLRIKLAYPNVGFRSRKKPVYRLEPPAVVLSPFVASGPKVNLNVMLPERSRSTVTRRRPTYQVGPPTIVGAGKVNPGLRVKLTFGRAGKPRSRLYPPTVLAAQPLSFGPQTTLAPSHTRSRKARPTYVYPAVVRIAQAFGQPAVQYVRRPRPSTRSRLAPPAAPPLVVLFYGPSTSLAYSRRGKPSSHLFAPTAVDQPEIGVLAAYTTRNSRPDTASSVLRPPAVVAPVLFALLEAIQLAPQRRPVAKSDLRAPAVIGAGVVYPGLRVKLVFGRRPVTKPRLAPPVVLPAAVIYYGPATSLAYSRRGKPDYRLASPAVVGAIVYYGPSVNPTFSKRGVPKSKLQPPAVVLPPPFVSPETVQLAPQRRPVAKPTLHAPAVVGPGIYYRGLLVKLVYPNVGFRSRKKPVYFLRPVAARAFEISLGPSVNLAPSRRPVAKSALRQAAAVAPILAPPLQITLAPQFRGKPKSKLRPSPLVPSIGRLEVTLAYQSRRRGRAQLRKPAVVGAGIFYRGLLVHLTYQKGVTPLGRRPKAVYFIGAPIGVIEIPPIIDYYDHPFGAGAMSSSPDEANFDTDTKGVMSSSPQQDEFEGDPQGKVSNTWRRRADREI